MAAQLTPVTARDLLVHVLTDDLIGPAVGSLHATETLGAAPSRWYLTGFLVPHEAGDEQRSVSARRRLEGYARACTGGRCA